MRHWPSRGQEKREGGANPALSLAVADWAWRCARRVCCASPPAAMTARKRVPALSSGTPRPRARLCVLWEERRSSQRASLTPGSTDNLAISVTVLGAEMLTVAL